MKINIKNENGNTVEFCCGEKEYALGPNEEISVEVKDEDCIYLDVMR